MTDAATPLDATADAGGGCASGTTQDCYDGDPATLDVGECRAGSQACVDGAWEASCTGAVLPSSETCDGRDEDCDGTVDDEPTDAGLACDTGLSGVCAAAPGRARRPRCAACRPCRPRRAAATRPVLGGRRLRRRDPLHRDRVCVAGYCAPGAPPSCDDGLTCAVDGCDAAADTCTYVPSDALRRADRDVQLDILGHLQPTEASIPHPSVQVS